ncbi:hypothetical protein M9H77_11897 [Catharanthus roseus]|uniref:Uncharacterized protein n=1 Tax=Catharanthus roseus TaxID=4058 RepID=A0ACC0BG19_CATRO|nr:hypothetical protein M9H77_11897 [Catharanthus roseus]
MAYTKLARARSNCYKDGGYGRNAYRGSHHRDRSIHRSQMGISNFSSRAKAFDHIPYKDCCENSPYDIHKGDHEKTKSCSFALDLDRNSLQHACTIISISGRRHTMEFGGQGKRVGGKLFLHYGDSSMSFSPNLFIFYLMFSFNELKLFLDGYVFFSLILHVLPPILVTFLIFAEVIIFLFCDVMGQRDHSLFVNVLHQGINLDRTHLLVVRDLFHDSLVFIAHDVEPWNICDSLGDANYRTFGFLGNNSYSFYGSLFSLPGDHCVKFQGEVVEHLQYVLTSLDPYVIGFDELNLVEKLLLIMKGLITPMWGMLPSYFLDPFVGNFLVKKVEGYLCSLIGHFLDKSIRRDVERCSYMIPFFKTFLIALNGIAPFENHFLNVKVQLENPCDDYKNLIGLKFLNAFLIENILGFQFYNCIQGVYVFVNF